MDQHLNIFPTVRAAITGQPTLPGVIFPGTVPARGRFAGVIASGAAHPPVRFSPGSGGREVLRSVAVERLRVRAS
jgi:hypothetical protein